MWVGILATVAALVVGRASQALDFDEMYAAVGLVGTIHEPVIENLNGDAVEAALDPSHFADPGDGAISEDVAAMFAAEIGDTTGSLRSGPEATDNGLRGSLADELQPLSAEH